MVVAVTGDGWIWYRIRETLSGMWMGTKDVIGSGSETESDGSGNSWRHSYGVLPWVQ